MSSIFSKIVNGEIPCYKIAENEHCLAFLDINPLKKGHVLVIPKVEVDKFYDLNDDLLSELILFSKKIVKKIEKAFDCKRVGMTIVGLEVPHAHIHLIPISTINDMSFSNPKLNLTKQELEEIAEKIVNG
ncbi:MAG: HIT family protein [Flavobacteriia bacterium]|nr:HIT family protein [Flavobacteriia bacterium]